MVECKPELADLSPVSGKRVVARFDGGEMFSDWGVFGLREIEERIGFADRLAGGLIETGDPERSLVSAAVEKI